MKNYLFPGLLVLIMLTSCAKYQYSTLQSNLPKNPWGEFYDETDTMLIQYRFSGNDGPARLRIENKLTTPLFVDWQRTGFRDHVEDQETVLAVTAVSEVSQADSIGALAMNKEIATLFHGRSIEMIPPASSVESATATFGSRFLAIPRSEMTKEYVQIKTTQHRIRTKFYNKSDSPFRFRSKVTLSADPYFRKTITRNHQFWVDEVTHTLMEPSVLGPEQPHNRFYISKSTGFSGVLTAVGAITWLTLEIALELDVE